MKFQLLTLATLFSLSLAAPLRERQGSLTTVTDTVDYAVGQAADTVDNTVEVTADTVDGAVSGAYDTVDGLGAHARLRERQGSLTTVTDTVDYAVGQAADTVDNTVEVTADTVDGAVNGAYDTVDGLASHA